MFNREEGKYRTPNPMGDASNAVLSDALQRTQTPVTPAMDDLINRLVTAYNNRAYGIPTAPMISKNQTLSNTLDGNQHIIDTLTAMTRDGDRLGSLSRDKSDNGIRYGGAIDNMGDPYRGVYDAEQSTPFGTLDYGYDGDTVAAGFTPNGKTQAYIQALANLLNRR